MSESLNPGSRSDAPAQAYRDRKRWAWLLSIAVPMVVLVGPLLMLRSNDPRLLWVPVVFFYLVAPLLDWLLGEDRSNPPESAVPQLEADRYYRVVSYLLVPVLWAAFIFSAWFVARHDLPWWGVLAMVLTAGSVGGFCINLGHELGHKMPTLERLLARLVLAPTGYGHFSIEHNQGHHRHVATPADPASSRMGESIYAFLLREMPGALRRAWQIESARLAVSRRAAWSVHNEILQTGMVTLALWGGLALWLGPGILVFVLAASFWANFQLTSANYVEHYGLLRQRRPSGRYEPCLPRHSWNSNHVFSNWALFHLQRHSDHHAHPFRRYQSLRHFDEAPQLPTGYFGMFTLAYFPPLWRRVMDPRLLAAVGRDASRINLDPRKRAALVRQYGLTDAPQPVPTV
ncbi:MAG: alkane 1-monooxygenase [Burkholderiaceae bacterium]|jgi:alkane 1-monooxygenase|nr:alkane 1-monooxygenase [Burkholderiaceae bacterium]